MGAFFKDLDDSGYSYVGSGDRGIEAHGDEMGGYFENLTASGYAHIAVGHVGIKAYGDWGGAEFTSTSGSGMAKVGWGDSGIQAEGSSEGAYFQETDTNANAFIASNNTGVKASGGLYDFYADGSGVNYGPFTGGHEVRISEKVETRFEPGMIVTVTGRAETRIQDDGRVNLSSTLPTVALASRPNDPRVFGVVVAEQPLHEGHWYPATAGERFATVNALGEGRVWVTDVNGPVRAGDLITTSRVPGYGQRQHDDLFHSYTLGKVIEDVDWSDAATIVGPDGKLVRAALVAVVYTSG
jgi:hypothetical protein